MTRPKLFALFILLMIGAGLLQYYYDSQIDYFARRNVFVTLPSGKTLKILSFGFRNLAADMLFIWSIQFYSSYHYDNRFDFIEHIFNTITDLNPRYIAPYFVGSWVMALEKKDYRMAIRLLLKGSKNMPDEWIFDHEAAFYAYKDLRDYPLAEKLFRRAADKPDAPAFLKRRRAHMVYLMDDLAYAYNLWVEIANNAGTKLEKNAARNHLYQIKFEMDKKALEERLKQYKNRFGRFPADLSGLKSAGYIREIPKDFKGADYIYDPREGKIKARDSYRWKKFF